MISNLLSAITNIIIHIISTLGYPGIGFLMALQTVSVPIPSEIILPFAGYLASLGRFNVWLIAIFGALGSCVGSSAAYYIGYKGGRPLVEKYGKFILVSHNDLEIADRFFQKHGSKATFFGMMLPIFRSFISFPAGISKVPYKKFLLYVFAGSFIWSLLLSYIGQKLGENWNSLSGRFHWLGTVIVVLIAIAGVWWVYRHFKHKG